MKTFEEMSQSELESKLLELQDLLEEVLEERTMILGQSNQHMSSKLVSKSAVKYAKEIDEIRGNITLVESLLQKAK